MDDFLRYQRHMLLLILGLTLAGAAALWGAFPEEPKYALGLLAGGVVGLGLYRWRAMTIARLATIPQSEWMKTQLKMNLGSYAIIAATAVAAGLLAQMDLYATIGGLVLERVVLQIDGALRPDALSDQAGDHA
jgi:hypothetical protein